MSKNQVRNSSIAGMVSAVLWSLALMIEYRFGLQPPGDGSTLYYIDQALFFIALAGYLVMLLGLWQSKAAGEGIFGKISVGLFIAGLAALLMA